MGSSEVGRSDSPFERVLGDACRSAGVVGAVLAVGRGDDVEIATFGTSDARGTPVDASTGFAIASVTKPMVATVVARLAARGLFALDDPVAAHVPELAGSPWGAVATARHLLANTSGVPLTAASEWLADDNEDGSLARFVSSIAPDPPLWQPGTTWSYCNAGWSVLGRLIETATGASWEEAMRAELFEPAEMVGTEFAHDPASGPRSAAFDIRNGEHVEVPPWSTRALGPAGASVYSTAGDLVRFGRLHVEDTRLASLRDEAAAVGFDWFMDAWCHGWARFDGTNGSVWGWDGIGSGFRSIVRIAPEQRGVVALLVNTSSGRSVYRDVVPEVIRDAFGIDLRPPAARPSPDRRDLARYEGRFAWRDLDAVVTADHDTLRIAMGGETLVGTPIDERSFIVEESGSDRMTCSFSAFDDGGVPHVFHRLVWGFPRVDVPERTALT